MVLIHSQKQAVSLEDELAMLRLYLDMECLRFKDSFHYNLVVPSTEEMGMVFVPPLILQPFCENAIWHGLLLKEGNGQLDISVLKEGDFLNCIIADNGIGRIHSAALKRERGEDNKSMGLKITGERLALFNKGKIDHASFEMEDLVNDDKTSSGTRVKIKIAYKNVPV
jgi:sensor histidine kinase YesM